MTTNATSDIGDDVIYREDFPPAEDGTASMQFQLRVDHDNCIAVFEVICFTGDGDDDKVVSVSRTMSTNDLRGMARRLEIAAKQLASIAGKTE